MSDEREPPLTDVEKVRLALDYGSEHTPALTREPVFIWTNAEAALDRLESQNQALQERCDNAIQAARATGMKLGEATAFARSLESQNQTLREEVDRLRHVVRHESPDMISCSCGATRHGIAVENQALQERIEEVAGYVVQLRPLSHEQALILPKLLQLVSPTQETDPE